MSENDPSTLKLRWTGPALLYRASVFVNTKPDKLPDRQVMLKGLGVRLFFCSVLSTQSLFIDLEPLNPEPEKDDEHL